MQISLDKPAGQHIIQAYKEDAIQINQKWYNQSFYITANTLEFCNIQSLQDWNTEHAQKILAYKPSLVLLGSSTPLAWFSSDIQGVFLSRQIGIEIMEIGAACRTFNMLLSDLRNVLGIFIPSHIAPPEKATSLD